MHKFMWFMHPIIHLNITLRFMPPILDICLISEAEQGHGGRTRTHCESSLRNLWLSVTCGLSEDRWWDTTFWVFKWAIFLWWYWNDKQHEKCATISVLSILLTLCDYSRLFFVVKCILAKVMFQALQTIFFCESSDTVPVWPKMIKLGLVGNLF